MTMSNDAAFMSYPGSVHGNEIGEALVLTALGRTLASRYDRVVSEPLPSALTQLLDALRNEDETSTRAHADLWRGDEAGHG